MTASIDQGFTADAAAASAAPPNGSTPVRAPLLLLTRPVEQQALWLQALRAAGCPTEPLPLIAIAPAAAQGGAPAWTALQDSALWVFVSANAVAHHFAQGRALGLWPAPWPDGLRATATGPGTANALRAEGVPESALVIPGPGEVMESESLWPRLAPTDWRGRRVFIVRGDGGREWMADRLREAGAQVEALALYRRTLPQWSAAERARFDAVCARPAEHVWLFSSGQAIDHLRQMADAIGQPGWNQAPAFCTHPRVAEAARLAGFERRQPVLPEVPSVVAAWRSWAQGPQAAVGAQP